MRRLIEIFERQNTPFHALFLDWSKAFDSVTFTAIQAAMEHAGIPAHTRRVTMALYNNPTFVVRDSSQKSAKHTQTRGLRQGCPLSYLFGLVVTHLFFDVERTYEAKYGEISGVFRVPSPLWDLEYVDDTVLLSCSAQQLNRLFHIVQYQGTQRGLQIHEEKCEHLRLHSDKRIYYSPRALLLVTADIALDMITLSLRYPYPTKSNIWGSTWTLSPLVEKIFTIAFRKQSQPPNCCAHSSLTHHFPLPGNSQYIAPLCYPFSHTPWIVLFFLHPRYKT